MSYDVKRRDDESYEAWLERMKGLVLASAPTAEAEAEGGGRPRRAPYHEPPGAAFDIERACEWCGGRIPAMAGRGAPQKFDTDLCRRKSTYVRTAKRFLNERAHDKEVGAKTWEVKL